MLAVSYTTSYGCPLIIQAIDDHFIFFWLNATEIHSPPHALKLEFKRPVLDEYRMQQRIGLWL